ncbi:MAG: YcgL domain-containing protein, partial [Pseudomonadota bacterium]|nr:YcgL domain-containing protein [Pseudomonadota bacterium]
FKTRKKDEMYLYVEKKEGFSRVPDELMDMFGKPELAMTLLLTPDKNLGRADAEKVLSDLDEKGFYLQMPPAKEPYMLDLFCRKDDE